MLARSNSEATLKVDMGVSVQRLVDWWGGWSNHKVAADSPDTCKSMVENCQAMASLAGLDIASTQTIQAEMQQEDASQRHCETIERLVSMGLSPQAANVALQHLDNWVVSEAGKAEMAAAEISATSAGQAILHMSDKVRFSNLKKSKNMNGKFGWLCSYRVEDNRWRVVMRDGSVFWVRPKQLEPAEDSVNSPQVFLDKTKCSSTRPDLAAKMNLFDAQHSNWKSEMESREIALLEREEQLRKLGESVRAQQQQLDEQLHTLNERRKCMAMDQARSIAEMESRAAAVAPQEKGMQRASLQFAMTPRVLEKSALDEVADGPRCVRTDGGLEALGDEVDDDDDDDGSVAGDEWDMDWSQLAVPSIGSTKVGSLVPRLNLCQRELTATTIAESASEDADRSTPDSQSICSPRSIASGESV